MSGDLYVRVNRPENAGGGWNNNVNIDANSVASGNMTSPVNVGGKNVFMTQSGAAEYSRIIQAGREREDIGDRPTTTAIHEDPGFLKKFFIGHSETNVGNP